MEPWEVAYRKWRELAEKGYGNRAYCNPAAMKRVDDRIRKTKEKYERLLAERNSSMPRS